MGRQGAVDGNAGHSYRSRVPRWVRICVPYVVTAALVLLAAKPRGVLVALPPRQEVVTRNPKVGVHTRLTDEVEEWKIQRSLAMVREMGAPWLVEYFPWAYIEPVQGKLVWEHSDAVIAHAENQGLRVIARLGMVPAWARPDPDLMETTFTYLDADRYEAFADYVEAFVGRYAGRVGHIIIWNEPNLSFEWGYRPVDPAGYVAMLRLAYAAAHRANPEVMVLAGALAPTLEPQGSSVGLSDLLYLRAMYQAGAASVFDGLAAHAYGLALAPEVDPADDLINFRRVELLRAIMDEHGDDNKPIFVTESGWNDHPRWLWAVRPAQRIRYTLDAYQWAADHWPWCPVVAMWMFRTPVPGYNYQDYYAFVTGDFEGRPIYHAVRDYTGNTASEGVP